MAVEYLAKGVVIGFSIAAPVGPIGVLCIRRSLVDGFLIGFATGLGAAAADATYGCVAAFGITAVSSFLVKQTLWFSLFGGVFLSYLGARSFLARVPEAVETSRESHVWPAFASTFILTLANPATILSFAAAFAGLGLAKGAELDEAGLLVAGVFGGSAAWWLGLSGFVGYFRARLNHRCLHWINRLSGAVLIAFGLYLILKLLTSPLASTPATGSV